MMTKKEAKKLLKQTLRDGEVPLNNYLSGYDWLSVDEFLDSNTEIDSKKFIKLKLKEYIKNKENNMNMITIKQEDGGSITINIDLIKTMTLSNTGKLVIKSGYAMHVEHGEAAEVMHEIILRRIQKASRKLSK